MDYKGKENLALFQGFTLAHCPFTALTAKFQGALLPPEKGKEGSSAWAGQQAMLS